MRTSYRSSHEENTIKEEINNNVQKEADKLYEDAVQENKEEKKRNIIFVYRSIISEKIDIIDENQAEEVVEEVKKKDENLPEKKKGKKVIIGIIIGLLVVIIGGVVLFSILSKQDNNLQSIQKRIDNLYTSDKKEDIKQGVSIGDLDKYYLDLNELQESGEDTSLVSEELDTIGYFISDKEMMSEYDSEDYDLTTSGLQNSITSIKENSEKYSVPGLAVTISDLCNKVNKDYEDFISLRSEMQSITDVKSFDEEAYKTRIANVKHKSNQEELNAIYNSIVADKKAAEAEQALKDAATQEAQEQAKKALEEAQKKQQETQTQLEEAEKKLQDKSDEVKESVSNVLDSITGSDSSDESDSSTN